MTRFKKLSLCISAFFSAFNRFTNRPGMSAGVHARVGRGGGFGAAGKRCVRSLAAVLVVVAGGQAALGQVTYAGFAKNIAPGAFNQPSSVAADAAGDLFVTNNGTAGVYEVPVGCTTQACVVALGGGWSYPEAVAVDASGNIYVADLGLGAVEKLNTSCTSSACMTAVGGSFGQPTGVAVDKNGNVYVADQNSYYIYKFAPSCTSSSCVTDLGGRYYSYSSVAVDASGNIYGTDYRNSVVRKMTPGCTGLSCTSTVYTGASGGQLDGVAVDAAGNLYVTDNQLGTAAKVSVGCGTTACAVSLGTWYNHPLRPAVDASGNVYIPDSYAAQVREVESSGAPNFASVNVGTSVSDLYTVFFTFSSSTTLNSTTPAQLLTTGVANQDYIADTYLTYGSCGYQGTVLYAGGSSCYVNVNFAPLAPGMRLGAVELLNASGAVLSTALISGVGTSPLATYSPGTISTVVGNGQAGYSGAGPSAATGVAMNLNGSYGMAVDAAGNLYIPEPINGVVHKVTASTGLMTTVAGTGQGINGTICSTATNGYGDGCPATSANMTPYSVALDGAGNLYIMDYYSAEIRKVNAATGVITAFASTGVQNNGGIAVDSNNNVYFADDYDSKIREVLASNGSIVTLAGTGTAGYSGDGGAAASAQINRPLCLTVDSQNNIYFADFNNGAVRKISNGIITTVVGGTGNNPYYNGGNVPATSVRLVYPGGLAVDPAGDVYIDDFGLDYVMKVSASTGVLSTIASYTQDFGGPEAIGIDGSGNLYVVDGYANLVREISSTPAALSFATTVLGATSSDSPQTVTFNNIGNTLLTFSAPATGTNPSIASGFSIGGSSTCPQLSTGSTGTLASGTSCTDLISFSPTVAGNVSGQLVTTDNSLNVTGSTQTVSLSGTGTNPTPTVTSVTPNTGSTAGGNTVTITGTGFTGATAVDFGTAAATSFTVGSGGTSITAVAPAHSAGTVYVTVSNPSSGSANSVVYTYATPAPAVTSISPSYGAAAGGGTITITGTGFISGASVKFGSTSATNVSVISSTSITAKIPAGTAGTTVDVTVKTSNGTSATTSADKYTYQATQTISFTQPTTPVTYGVSPITLSATATSGLPVTFSITSGAAYGTLSGTNNSVLTITGVGSITIAANQAGNSSYAAATAVSRTLVVNQATQTISFTQPTTPVTYGVSPITLLATGGSSGNPVTFSITSGAAYGSLSGTNNSVLTVTGAGSITIAANQAGNSDYSAATPVSRTLVVNQASQTISFTALSSPVTVNATATLAATASSGGAVTYTVTSGTATISGTTVTFTNAGSVTIAANSAATANYLAAPTVSQTITVNAEPMAYSAPTEPVGTASAVQTAYVNFTAAGTLGTVSVLTQGAAGLDFKATGGTCAVGTAYTVGQACSVTYMFTPKYPGQRVGGITLLSSTGTPLGSSYLSGRGTGPQAIFPATATRTNLGGSSYDMFAAAVDGNGNFFYVDPDHSLVHEITAASGYTSVLTIGSGFNAPYGIALDGNGNVFVGDGGKLQVYELLASSGYATVVPVGSGYGRPSQSGVAVDASGNLFVSDYAYRTVTERTAASGYNTVTTILSGLNFPAGVAVDASGNVFVVDQGARTVTEVLASSGYTTTQPVGSGYTYPTGIAVDASGNVYVADGGAGIKEVLAAGGYTTVTNPGGAVFDYSIALNGNGNLYLGDGGGSFAQLYNLTTPPSLAFGTLNDGSVSTQSFTVGNSGNAALTAVTPGISGLTSGVYAQVAGSGTPADCTSSFSLASGATCNVSIKFAPVTPNSGAYADSYLLTDNSLNGSPSATQTIAISGTAVQLSKSISFPALTSPVTVNATATLAAYASNGDPVTYSVTSGTATISGTTVTFTNAGSVTIAANSAATSSTTAAATVSQTITVNAEPSAYSAPTEPVGTVSAVQTAYVNITTAGTLSAINVLTKGSPNIDFKLVSGGTCTTNTVYSVGQACSVEYSFTPTAAGVRIGGITLVNSAGAVLGSSYLGGTGTAPVGVFNAGVQSTFYNVGDGGQNGMTLDGAGDLYYSDLFTGTLYEVKVGTQTPIVIATGLGIATDVAVDGIGDIFYGSDNQNTIFELKAGSTTPVLLDTPLNPEYFAVDAAGNLFAAIAGEHVVKEYLANGTTATFGTGLSHPQAIALDASDNIYLTDRGLNEVLKITPDNVQTVLASGFGFPVGIAMDPAGNIYVADTSNNSIDMLAAGTYALSQVSSGWSAPKPLFMDAAGNLYVANTGTGTIIELNRSAGSLSFASTSYGATSAAQQTAFVNIGNEPLTISAVTASTNFQVDAGNTCTVGSLASGANCVLAADFAPLAVGPLTGTLTVTDNSLNQASFAQITSLSGTATQATQSISFTAPASPVTYGTAPIALVATGGASGNPVTFSIVSGAAYGSISGSTLTVTGAGTIVIAANQAGNTNYVAATQVTQTVVVNKATPTVTAATPAGIKYGTASTTLSATVAYMGTLAPTGAVSFTIDSGSAVTASCSGTGSPLTCTASYPTSALSAGPHTITASVGADSNYVAASGGSTLTVSQSTPSITVFAPANFTYGTAQVTLTGSLSWSGPATPSGAFTFSIDGGAGIPGTCSVGGACTATYNSAALSAGQHTLSAALASDTDYTAATSNTVPFAVSRAPLTVSIIGTPSKVYDGTTTATLTPANYVVGGLVGTDAITITQAAGTYAAATAGPETVTATLSAANFTAASGTLSNYVLPKSASGGGTITKATTTVSWTTPAAITYGTALSGAQLNATVGVAGTFVYSPASGTVLGAGQQTLNVSFTPTDGTDYTASTGSVTLTVNPAPQVVAFSPAPASPDVAGDSVVLSATGGLSGNPVVFSVLSGNASLADDGVTLTYTGAGTVVVAADQAAGGNYAQATEATATIVVNPAAAAYNAGTVPVASQSSILTATLNFPNGGTLGSLSYLTQGAANLDYIGCTAGPQAKHPANPKGGTPRQTTFTCPSSKSKGGAVIPVCSVGTAYSAGQICTVSYIFQPTAPGQRLGAVVAVDSNGNPMGTSYLSGIGTGPQAAFYPGTQSVIDGSNAGDPFEVATDAAGDIYLGSFGTSQILKYTPNGGVYSQSTIGGGFGTVAQIVVDGAGNLLVADPQNSQVLAETLNPSNGLYTQSVLFNSSNSSDNSAWAVAKDASGNVFLSGSGQLLMESPLPAGGYAETVLPFSFNFVTSLALDSSGDLFVADAGAGTLYELTNNGNGNYTQSVVVSGYGNLNGVAVDASGVVYASSTSSSSVLRYVPVAGGGYAPLAPLGGGFARLNGVGLDSAGNVYVADDGGPNTLSVIQVSTPASLSFADTNVGSTSSDSPQVVTISNNGYDPTRVNPLLLSGVSNGTANFVLDAATTCSGSSSLEPGQTCALAVDFTPQAPGTPLTDAVTLVDNSLNAAGSTQAVALSGNGLQQTPVITVAPVTISYTTASTTLSASVAYTGTIAPTGAVSFTVDGGSAVTAVCSGTTSPLSCTATYATATLAATAHTITATLAPTPGFLTASGTGTLTVTPIAPTITFTVPNHTYGDAPVALTASSNSSAPFTYTLVSGPAAISGSTLTITGAGPVTVQASQIAAGNYIAGSQNAEFGVAQATLTVSIIGTPTKVYDATTAATLSPANYLVGGLVGTDAIAINLTAGVYAAAAAGAETVSVSLAASNYTATLGSLANYILPVSASGPGTINPATSVTAVSCPASVTYNGTAQTPCSATVTGVGGLSQTLTVTYASNVNAGVNTASATATYAGDANHTGSTQTVQFTIAPALLTVTAGSYSGVYDGNTHAVSACTVSTNFDALTCADSPAQVGPDFGSGVVTPVISGSTANYTVTSVNGPWSITAKPVTVSAGSYSGTYDGNAHAVSACTSSYAGIACTDSPASVGPGAGSGVVTPVVSVVGGVAADYTVTPQNGAWTIAQASSVTSVSCPTSVTYNGAAQTPCTATVTGAGGLSQSVNVTYSANVNIGLVTASATFAGDANHTGSTNSTTFTITPALLTLTAGSYTGVYDGNTHALSGCVVSSNPDGLTCTNSPVGPVGPDVGSATVVPVVSGATGNYTVTKVNGAWSITPLAVSVTAGSYSGTYDGGAHAVSACVSGYSGVTCADSPASVGPGAGSGTVTPVVGYASGVPADYAINATNGAWSIAQAGSVTSVSCPASVVYNGTAQTPCTATVTGAGGLSQSVSVSYLSNTNVGQAQASATFAGDANHTGSTKTVTFSITPALLTVTAGGYSGVYDGNTHALSGCVVSSNPDGLTCTNSPVGPVGPDVGGATVVPVVSGSTSNYTVTKVNGAWSITPLAVSVTAGSYSGTYDGNSHAPSACSSSYAGVSCSNSPASVGPGVGSGAINPVASFMTGNATDYTVSKTAGSYSITKLAASVTPNAATKVYGTADPALSGTLSGFLPADGVTATYSRVSGESVGGSPYTISATLSPTAVLANYSITYNTAGFTITKATPVVSWTAPAAITYGTVLSGTQLNAAASVAGTLVYTPAAGSLLHAGTQTLSVSFTPTDTTDYTTASGSVTLTVNQATPVVTWNTPASIVYGTALSTAQQTATATGIGGVSLPGSYFYTEPNGEVFIAGVHALGVAFTPTDIQDYVSVSAYTYLTVTKATPTITWATPAAITYGTALSATQLNATASVPGTLSYTPALGSVLHAGAQTLTVTFTPSDATDYGPTSATVTLTVNQATPVVTWNNPPSIVYGTATGVAQQTATANVPGSFFYTQPSGVVLKVGSYPLGVAFTPTDTQDYTSVSAYATLTVTKATPVITWPTPAAIVYGTALSATQLNASASVAGSFVYTPAAGAVLTAGTQTLSAVFTPTDTADYTTATGSVTLTVTKATPVITWPTPASITYGTPLSATQLDATANVAGTFLYTAATGANPLGVVLPPGTTALSATLTPTDTNDYNPVTAYVVFTVSKAQTSTTLAVTTTQTVTGTTATLTATVKPQIAGTPTGTVTYYNGSTALGSAAVGTPFTTGVLPVGTDQITAVYSGDSNFVGSSSSANAVTSVAPTVVQLRPTLSSVFYPASAVGFTVTVPLKNLQLISGTVTLYDGGTVIGTYSLPAGGVLAGVTPQLSVGTHNLLAVYSGNAQYPSGESAVATVTVSQF